MPLIHLLFDLENLRPSPGEIALVRAEQYRLWVFRGPNQKKYDAELAEAWQPLGKRVEFVRCTRNGKNALDFHIAFVMGRIVGTPDLASFAGDGGAEFVVVSKDNGFDALFEYVQSLGYKAARATSLTEAVQPQRRVESSKHAPPSAVKPAPPSATPKPSPATRATTKQPASPKEKLEPADVERIVDHLRAHPKNRPASRRALQRHIPTIAGTSLSSELIEEAIVILEQQGVVTYAGTKISYRIPKKPEA
jgi:hypothetical protein